jgi:hypothetical protein
MLLQRAQDADVCNAARESASERKAHKRTSAIFAVREGTQPLNSPVQPIRCIRQRTPEMLETLMLETL